MKKTFVTKTVLPDLEEYVSYLKKIWSSHHVTNNGIFVQELKKELELFLRVKNLCLLTNGTVALQIAFKALDLQGEVITTPFSYVATTSTLVWEGLKPVFVDINPHTFNIDPTKIEASITPQTSAILATHVFGNPCAVEEIQAIADKHNLKVIYDAAHAFDVQFKGKSIFEYGDISTLSFHSTKVFHTVEGGAIVAPSADLFDRSCFMRNFGHNGTEDFAGLGINGKMDEFRAAMGLCLLPKVKDYMALRKAITLVYDSLLFPSDVIHKPKFSPATSLNYIYYPIIFEKEEKLHQIIGALNEREIYPRRYFFPCLANLPYVEKSDVPVAESITKRVLCLPLSPDLSHEKAEEICEIILNALQS